MANYLQEIDALQRWVYRAAALRTMRLSGAPPTVARPTILWENPSRGRSKNLGQYTYVVRVQQFGKLHVENFDQAAVYQEKLLQDLEDRYGVLQVYKDDQGAEVVALLKAVTVEFGSTETLDIPVTVTYEATYGRQRPQTAPLARVVGTKVTVQPLQN